MKTGFRRLVLTVLLASVGGAPVGGCLLVPFPVGAGGTITATGAANHGLARRKLISIAPTSAEQVGSNMMAGGMFCCHFRWREE